MPAVRQRLQEISELGDDWDGYGSPAPSTRALVDSLDALRRFMPRTAAAPAVAPTTDGGVQFEWHQGGWDIEVEVPPGGTAVAWGENTATRQTFHGPVEQTRRELARRLKQMSDGGAPAGDARPGARPAI